MQNYVAQLGKPKETITLLKQKTKSFILPALQTVLHKNIFMQKESTSRVKEINYLCRGFFQIILLFFRDRTRIGKRNNFKLRSLKASLLGIPNFIHFLLQAIQFCFEINSPLVSSSFFREPLRQF